MINSHKLANELLEDPWSYKGLKSFEGEQLMKLSFKPSFYPWSCWALGKQKDNLLLRRVTCYHRPNNCIDSYGSEVIVQTKSWENIFQRYQETEKSETDFGNLVTIDGAYYSVQVLNEMFSWNGPQKTKLEKWLEETSQLFEEELPTRTPYEH